MSLANFIENTGFIPKIDAKTPDLIVEASQALSKSNIDIAEVSAKNISPASISKLKAALSGIVIGVSDVENIGQAVACINSGAEYIAIEQPGETLLEECKKRDIFVIPICRTVDEIELYYGQNIRLMYLIYPDPSSLEAVDDIGNRFPEIKLIVKTEHAPHKIEYFSDRPYVAALAGKWICPGDMIDAGMFEKISENAAKFVCSFLNFKIAHVGINAVDEEMARRVSDGFSDILGIPATEKDTSFFVSTLIEVNKAIGRGEHGHIAIKVFHINRAVYHIEKRGYKIDTTPLTEGRSGPLYLHTEVGGFALHLLQKG